MTVTRLPIILICAFTLGACATSQPSSEAEAKSTSATETKVAATEASGKNKVICKKMAPTGSRLARKVCGTKEQWDAAAEISQEALRKTRRTSVMGNPDS